MPPRDTCVVGFPSITRVTVLSTGVVVTIAARDPLAPGMILPPERERPLPRQHLSTRPKDRGRIRSALAEAGRFVLVAGGFFRRHVRSGRDSELWVTVQCQCGQRRERPYVSWQRRLNVDRGCSRCTVLDAKTGRRSIG